MKTAAIALSLLLGALLLVAAPSAEDIRAAEEQWSSAVEANDFSKIESCLADDLIYAHSTGAVETKSEYMARLRKGAQKYDAIRYEKTAVRVHGDTAVAHSHVRMTGTSDGAPFDNRLMMMHVWVKRGERWQLVAHQTTQLP